LLTLIFHIFDIFYQVLNFTSVELNRFAKQAKHRAISLQEKMSFSTPGWVVLGLPSPSPRVCTGGQAYAEVTTKKNHDNCYVVFSEKNI